ncbi:MAG: hypothetical protein ACR2LI_03390 [Propionibacteriaceae bacterium]
MSSLPPSRPVRHALHAVLTAAVVVPLMAACGSGSTTPATPSGTPTTNISSSTSGSPSSTPSSVAVESAPPGDIPDNVAFVPYANQPGHYTFTHPEGWARSGSGTSVQFTDKLNGVQVDSSAASQAPTVATARSLEVARLQGSVPAFELRGVSPATVPAGPAVRIVFRRNSDPDPVTGKVYRDEVQEYLVYGAGRQVRMDLYGPVGADNVDAYATMVHSLVIR